MTENTSRKTNTRRDQIEHIISQNQGIADISILREELLKHLTVPMKRPAHLLQPCRCRRERTICVPSFPSFNVSLILIQQVRAYGLWSAI